jgi:putative glutamine amidotransferase
MKMKIGLSMRMVRCQKPGHTTGKGEVRHAISQDWMTLLQKLGFTPVLLPSDLKDIPQIDGVILTNGNNVDPRAYGGKPLDDVFAERDAFEARLAKMALGKKIPILGACRGSQMLNVFFGGKLKQHVAGHSGTTHAIALRNGKRVTVNSYHDHGIAADGLGNYLEPLAFSDDGFIEAFGHKSVPAMGIMWHPERGPTAFNDSLVKRFFTRRGELI